MAFAMLAFLTVIVVPTTGPGRLLGEGTIAPAPAHARLVAPIVLRPAPSPTVTLVFTLHLADATTIEGMTVVT